jgi:hypothetical protein
MRRDKYLRQAWRDPENTPKSDMRRRGIDRFGMARSRSIAAAIAGRAKMGAALQHLPRNFDVRLMWIAALFFGAAARIPRYATGLLRIGFMFGGIPVRGPLPNVANHVVKSEAIGKEGCHRRSSRETVRAQILIWEIALPRVGAMFSVGCKFIAPCVFGLVKSAASRKFSFGLSR